MLIDELRETCDDPKSALVMALGDKGRQALIKNIEGSMKFILDDVVTIAAASIGTSKPSKMVEALPLCRLPFKTTWIECRNAARDWHNNDPERPPPPKIGMLFNGIDRLQRGTMHLVWKHSKNAYPSSVAMNMSVFSYAFDLDGSAVIDKLESAFYDQATKVVHDELRRVASESHSAEVGGKDEVAALHELLKRMTVLPNPYLIGLWEGLMNKYPNGPPPSWTKELQDGAVKDWAGEVIFFLCSVLFINSKRSIKLEHIDMGKLARRRAKRGRSPVYSHTVVKLSITDDQQKAFKRASTGDLRAHFVMGHWKIRKTGVFFWMPHIRGNRTLGFVDKDYEVVK